MQTREYLIHFQDDAALDPDQVGHKFASLAKAYLSGLPVPFAVAISVEVHRFHKANDRWPEGVLQSVCQAAAELQVAEGLSVRSSATLEDLPDRSFAGQYETFLNVRNEKELQQKIEACWGSSERIPSCYAQPGGQRPAKVDGALMAVILQRMVLAAASGVAFSKNPMFPGRREVVIECIEGLGDRLVSGHVTPYRGYVRDGQEVFVESPHALHSGGKAPLNPHQWLEIAALARRAEEVASGLPQDIEWSVDREGKLWLLQSRPITTIREADAGAPEGVWTRRIADDLWADRLTPFLADAMLRNSSRFDLSHYSRKLGIAVMGPTLAVINGFLYVNCDALGKALELIPRGLRTADLRRLFPPGYEMEVASPSLSKMVSVLLLSIALSLTDPVANPLFCHRITLGELKKLKQRVKTLRTNERKDDPRAIGRKLHEAVELMASLQEVNQWPYTYATVFTWMLRWVIVDLAGMTHEDFLRLLNAGADNITLEIESELRRVADLVRGKEELRDSFCSNAPGELIGALPDSIKEELAEFIRKYGVRSKHRTLLVKRWAEAPEQVLGMLVQLVGSSTGLAQPANPEFHRPFHRASKAVDRVFSPIQQLARKYMDLREELRFLLDEILYLIRSSLLELGAATGLGHDVMFLTEQALVEFIEGRTPPAAVKTAASEKRTAFQQQQEPHTYYVDGRPISDLISNKGLLEGIGTSAGRVSGYARIVEDPSTVLLTKGDILVAKNTDPGWTPILSIVAGVVTEEGGLLNHCSIVARELGIPAVVGIREATRRIPEGGLIVVDGDLGIVRMAERQSSG